MVRWVPHRLPCAWLPAPDFLPRRQAEAPGQSSSMTCYPNPGPSVYKDVTALPSPVFQIFFLACVVYYSTAF